jgi:hypothetical protein
VPRDCRVKSGQLFEIWQAPRSEKTKRPRRSRQLVAKWRGKLTWCVARQW